MSKIEHATAPTGSGSRYPAPFDAPCQGRHWHEHEDEFVQVISGEVVLVTDAGEQVMRAGDGAGFKAGSRDGHHLQNRSGGDAVLLVVGSRSDADWGEYPDIDLKYGPGRYSGSAPYLHKDGRPY